MNETVNTKAPAVETEGRPGRLSPSAETEFKKTSFFGIEDWACRHNEEIWGTGPDGTYAWNNGPAAFLVVAAAARWRPHH